MRKRDPVKMRIVSSFSLLKKVEKSVNYWYHTTANKTAQKQLTKLQDTTSLLFACAPPGWYQHLGGFFAASSSVDFALCQNDRVHGVRHPRNTTPRGYS